MTDSHSTQAKDNLRDIYQEIRSRISGLEAEKEQLIRDYRRALEEKGVEKVKKNLHENARAKSK